MLHTQDWSFQPEDFKKFVQAPDDNQVGRTCGAALTSPERLIRARRRSEHGNSPGSFRKTIRKQAARPYCSATIASYAVHGDPMANAKGTLSPNTVGLAGTRTFHWQQPGDRAGRASGIQHRSLPDRRPVFTKTDVKEHGRR